MRGGVALIDGIVSVMGSSTTDACFLSNPRGVLHGAGRGDGPSPGSCKLTRRLSAAPLALYDCFSIVNEVVVPCCLSLYSTWMDLPSFDTVM